MLATSAAGAAVDAWSVRAAGAAAEAQAHHCAPRRAPRYCRPRAVGRIAYQQANYQRCRPEQWSRADAGRGCGNAAARGRWIGLGQIHYAMRLGPACMRPPRRWRHADAGDSTSYKLALHIGVGRLRAG